MDGLQRPSAELHALKDEFDRHSQQIAELRSDFQTLQREREQDVNALAAISPLSRRQILQVGGVAGAIALLASNPAAAATDPTDGDGDLGNSANPWDTYLNGLALDAQDISSATTVDTPVVRYDPSVSGFTITIDSDLEGPSGYSQPVVLQEVGGSSNAVTVDTQSGNGVNGGASISLSKAYATTVLYWTGSEWRTGWFTDTVDTGALSVSNETLVQVYLGSNQSLTAGSFEPVELSSEIADDLGEFNTTTHQFTPTETGFYTVSAFARLTGVADQDEIVAQFTDVDATVPKILAFEQASGTSDLSVCVLGTVELTGGNSHEFQVRDSNTAASLVAARHNTFLTIRSAFA